MINKVKSNVVDYFKSMFQIDMFAKRIIMSLVSCFVIPLGISILSLSNFGVDPFTSFMLNLSEASGIEYPILQLILYSAILSLVLLFSKPGLVGLGTILNMVITGFVFDSLNTLYTYIPTDITELFAFRSGCLIVGLVILCFGCSLFFTAGIGVGAYDTIAFLMVRKSKMHYKWARVITDCASVVFGLLFAGVLLNIITGDFSSFPNVGIGTIITAFFMGPLISSFNDNVASKLLAYDYGSKKSSTSLNKCETNNLTA